MLWMIFVVFAATDPAIPPDLAGKWYAGGQLPAGPNGGHGMSWKLDYDIHPDGTFLMTGYPPITVTGKIKVIAREKGRIHVLLYERKMSGSDWPDLDDWAVFSADGKQMTLDKKDFTRGK